jgi:hypothetical protein
MGRFRAKARLIELGKDGDYWTQGRRGHDLPWLVSEAGVAPDDADAFFLPRLQDVVTWSGRYPDPLRNARLERGDSEGFGHLSGTGDDG